MAMTLYDVITKLNINTTELLTKYTNILDSLPKLVKNEMVNNMPIKEVKEKILQEGNIVDFYLVENGKALRYASDEIDSDLVAKGYELFCPHNHEEYEMAREFLLKLNKPKAMGPLGIYYPHNSPSYPRWISHSWCSGIPLNSANMGKMGWKIKDGNRNWWASDLTNVTEPNGDYAANAYLGITYDNNGYIKWYNDANANYVYKTYLCVKRVKRQ